MPNLDLTDDEQAALVPLVKHAIDTGRFPMSPRLFPLRATLAKLEPQPLREPVTTQGLRTAEPPHFNDANIVVRSVDRAQCRETDVDYRSDGTDTGRLPGDRLAKATLTSITCLVSRPHRG